MNALMLACFGAAIFHGQTPAQAVDPRVLTDLTPTSLDRAAGMWVNAAASGDLVPALTVEAPVTEIPPTYFADVAIIQDTSRRCRWRPSQAHRSLLLCVDDLGFFPRHDTPRAQLLLPRIPSPGRSNRAPAAAVEVIVR